MTARRAFLRLEIMEALRSRWVVFAAAVYVAAFVGFVWFGLRESSVLGFTGVSRVALNVANVMVVAMPLVALLATAQSVVRARSTGMFELLLAQPVSRGRWLDALVASRLAILLGPLAVLFAGTLVVGAALGERHEVAAVARSGAVTLALVFAFIGLGVALSVGARTVERALVAALSLWVLVSALHDFALLGLLLRWHIPAPAVFTLAALNPVESARVGLLGSVDPELSVLGPVGFFLATKLGPTGTLLVSILWPMAIGAVSLAWARRRFSRADLV
jgi:ABC-type transport system involved in multi-copper enzyme maturation permease subunit